MFRLLLSCTLLIHLTRALLFDEDEIISEHHNGGEGNDVGEYESGGADLSHLGAIIFGKPNEESGRKLEKWNAKSQVNPEELGEYAEGDILFPMKFSKNGLIAQTARWPNGEVPYEITGYFTKQNIDMIKNAMEQYHKYTCIKFRRKESKDTDWISITSTNTGCWSSVGRTGGSQDVNLQTPGCFGKIGTVMHELLHAVGFQHEQNRWERDSYVNIHWENIQKGKDNNFKKASKATTTGFGVPYDYGSVMHYSGKAFSQNGEPTITVLKGSDVKIGQRAGFSDGDLQKIRQMYNCPASSTNENSGIDNGTDHGENPGDGGGGGGGGLLGGLINILFP